MVANVWIVCYNDPHKLNECPRTPIGRVSGLRSRKVSVRI